MISVAAALRIASAFACNCRLAAFSSRSRNTDRPLERKFVPATRWNGDVLGLLMPQVAVDFAALQQLAMPADIMHPATFEDENRVRGDQGRQAVRNDDHSAAVSDPCNVGVDDRFAVGIERAGCF